MIHNMIEEDVHIAYVLYRYIEKAMSEAVYENIDDNEYAGKIPSCLGIIAFAQTLEGCKQKLLSVLEDWIMLGLRYGHPLPVVGGVDPNNEINMRMELSNEKIGTV